MASPLSVVHASAIYLAASASSVTTREDRVHSMWVASGPDCETVRGQTGHHQRGVPSVAGRVDDRVLRRRPVRRFLILSRDYAECRPDCLHNRSSRAEGCGGESPRDIWYRACRLTSGFWTSRPTRAPAYTDATSILLTLAGVIPMYLNYH
jgi:hypothetical protein